MAKLTIGESNGCWLDVFGNKGARGKAQRLYGPADFPMLRIREGALFLVKVVVAGVTRQITGIDFDDEAYTRVGAKIAPDAAAVMSELGNRIVALAGLMPRGTRRGGLRPSAHAQRRARLPPGLERDRLWEEVRGEREDRDAGRSLPVDCDERNRPREVPDGEVRARREDEACGAAEVSPPP